MFKAVFGRNVKMPCGCEARKEMGVNTWAAFAGSDDNALVDGDFVVLADELQAALKSPRKSGINIVAIHHHMIGDEPRMIFFHYWGRGSARDLATAVATALKTTKTDSKGPASNETGQSAGLVAASIGQANLHPRGFQLVHEMTARR
jgi:hypothetical protein